MKYFVVSDIHSCYTALIKSLNAAGYDKDNSEHVLISCGDIFDRGAETVELYNFIKSIPKSNRVLIRGNHEFLLRELLLKGFVSSYDRSNGTVKTVAQITGAASEWQAVDYIENRGYSDKLKLVWDIVDWIFESDDWVNYYELDNYIFVHSFIPTTYEIHPDNKWAMNRIYDPDWRNVPTGKGEEATGECPFEMYEKCLFEENEPGKYLVYGHWHAGRIRQHYEGKAKKLDHSIYQHDMQIALDTCTNLSDKVNVLVLDL